MRKELPVILVNNVVDPKRIIVKKWRAKEVERHKGSLTQKSIRIVLWMNRLGNFLPTGSSFMYIGIFGEFFKLSEVAQILRLHFPLY
jgi:hypothetical protein